VVIRLSGESRKLKAWNR